ncbi:alpha/beta fold hydrolase [Jongsikchunia kroppenstedtii]|uniref:alpha/beta fold hydrolase n=1 Tax=Jongsikchunia kroppenstedtii TaxID=1121721 RepID=UPI001FE07535|nr:alpha/beta hydrolase family protein [Jongsikchunia kroppenstedtii]
MSVPASNPEWTGGDPLPAAPTGTVLPPLTAMQRFRLAPQIALDDTVLAIMRWFPAKLPDEATPERLAAEMAEAAALFQEQGWLADPVSYHRTPPPLTDDELVGWRKRPGLWGHETVAFESGFAPRPIEPGVNRWRNDKYNATVPLRVLRGDPNAPWVVCLHGFGMGSSRQDLSALRATVMHKKLGLNVVLPTSPLHGSRNAKGDGQLLTLDLSAMLHGVTQAVWEIRRIIGWIRANSAAPVGVYGVSLGGFLSTLISALEPVDVVAAAIPFVDPLGLLEHHGPPDEYRGVIASADARSVYRVIAPLVLPTAVARDRRSLLAARADRLIPRQQSVALGEAWRDGTVQWFNSAHAGFTWSRAGKEALADRLRATLLAGPN